MYTNSPPGASVFEVLRQEVPLDRLLEANGQGKALCVAHDEKTPSLHLYDDHAHCFGCLFHGDVVTVWSAMKGISRPIEAARDLAREFNVRLPEISEESAKRNEERREQEQSHLEKARKQHAALDKHPRVREWWEGRGFGPELQKRFLLGASSAKVATIPFWQRGRIKGIIRRRLEEEPKYLLPKAEEFTEGHRPLFIPGGAPINGEIFLVEGYVDALALAAVGKAGVAVGGTGASEEQLSGLKQFGKIRILPDGDEEGGEAATTWARTLYPATRICPADYGPGEASKDVADLFAASSAPDEVVEHLNRLVDASRDILDIEIEAAAEIDDQRKCLAYTIKYIAPLLAAIKADVFRDQAADIVVQKTPLKKKWVDNAIRAVLEAEFAREMQEKDAKREAEAQRRREEYAEAVAEIQPEIDDRLAPGVLERLRDAAAEMHSVYGDREPLELALLVALGAQLDPLPNGRPLGASILLTATAGRGKNHIIDAAVKPLPPEFYFAFEIASGQSLYYKADEDPDFLRHVFAYPNEIEGAEALWEFLRPMLSKGWAKKIVTAKDADGNMTTRTIIVEGPVTIAIPTIRNKTDEQLQTRLLVAELPDYVGRVAEHGRAVSQQLLPEAAAVDYSHEQWIWREALRQLTAYRRVVFPLNHEKFTLDDDQVSHGARMWANLLSLMATNGWLEQKSRERVELSGEKVAVVATPEDYEVAYRIFSKVCKRTVVNLSEAHRKILTGLYKLRQEQESSGFDSGGFSQRALAVAAGVSQSTVAENKTFLVMSAKLMLDTENGLKLVKGAEPSWWEGGDLMKGLPTPKQVWQWWEENPPDPPKPADQADQADHPAQENHKADAYAESGDRHPADHSPITDRPLKEEDTRSEGDRQVIGNPPISDEAQNLIDKQKENGEGPVIGAIGMIGGFREGEEDSCSHGTGDPQSCDECEIDRLFGADELRI